MLIPKQKVDFLPKKNS